jgi:hypothetical protein
MPLTSASDDDRREERTGARLAVRGRPATASRAVHAPPEPAPAAAGDGTRLAIPPAVRPRRSQFELRCYAGRDLYERVLREAAARRVSVSECLRRDLGAYYAIQDELAGVVTVDSSADARPGPRILHTLLAEMETRLVASMDRQSAVFEESLRAVAWMIDQGLLMLLGTLEERSDGQTRRPLTALQRHDAWRSVVQEGLASGKATPPAPRQLGRPPRPKTTAS